MSKCQNSEGDEILISKLKRMRWDQLLRWKKMWKVSQWNQQEMTKLLNEFNECKETIKWTQDGCKQISDWIQGKYK
jgi:murein L,D-transpeptidase YafK